MTILDLLPHTTVLGTGFLIYRVFRRLDHDPAIRSGAKQEVARYLQNLDAHYDSSPIVRYIKTLLIRVFSQSHFSLRCIKYSLTLTSIYFIFFGAIFLSHYSIMLAETPKYRSPIVASIPIRIQIVQDIWKGVPYIFIISCVGDYLSLGKGRYVLSRIQHVATFFGIIKWMLVDIFFSLLITVIILMIAVPVAGYVTSGLFTKAIWVALQAGRFRAAYEAVAFLMQFESSTSIGSGPVDLTWVGLFLSTLTASLWIMFITISVMFVKGISYLNPPLNMVRWIFDVENHPFSVIGRVVSALFVIIFMLLAMMLPS
jgi:hypothetical protein